LNYPTRTNASHGFALALAIICAFSVATAADNTAQIARKTPPTSAAAGTMVVSQAWARATPPGIDVAAGYLTMENRGRQADTLLSISSPIADSAGLHQTTTVNGMSNMRMAESVVLAPGQTLRAEPRGLHVMLMGLKKPLVKGTKVPLVLTFRNAGTVTVQVDILATDATAYENHAGH
jgi:copper(I)-binding protein